MSNDYLNVNVLSDFQYTSSSYKSGDWTPEELTEIYQQELLQYQMYFQSMDWTDSEIQHICDELIKTGKVFATNQGFGTGHSVRETASGRLRVGTGNLVNSIRANPETRGNFKTINFYNDAKNERNQYYAGHLEYGFHDRQGKFVPARPFMRPAMYAVAEGSKANFRNIMRGLLENLWTGRGFNGVSNLLFGAQSSHRWSNFWGNKDFSSRLGAQSRLKELRGDTHRKQLSSVRGNRPNAPKKMNGFRLAKNKKDYLTMRTQGPKKNLYSSSKSSSTKSHKSSTPAKPSYKGAVKSTPKVGMSSKSTKGPTHPYGRQSDYSNFKHFAETHFNGSLRDAKSHWREMEK